MSGSQFIHPSGGLREGGPSVRIDGPTSKSRNSQSGSLPPYLLAGKNNVPLLGERFRTVVHETKQADTGTGIDVKLNGAGL